MKALVTYCSAEKRRDAGVLPAVERYESWRIREVARRARTEGTAFFILSGEFGLLAPEDPIPYYDHLLLPKEAAGIGSRVGDQLRAYGVAEVTFVSRDPAREPPLAAYHAAITAGCARAGATLRVEIFF